MLVLSRRLGESIVITVPGYPPITVKACGVTLTGEVKLGFTGPPEVTIDRSEVHAKKLGGVKGE